MKYTAYAAALCGLLMTTAASAAPEKPECLSATKPGGGFDLTCRLAAAALLETGKIKSPMAVSYMESAGGVTAYNHIASVRNKDKNLIIAASTGSALLLAQGKFGLDENAVRWLGGIAADYGAIAVHADSPHKTLTDLAKAYAANPGDYPIGGTGVVGSQDWMKAAMFSKSVNVDPKSMRYASFEGGGAISTAMLGKHVAIASSDVADLLPLHKAGKLRILAVLSDERLPGDLSDLPTAKEQGSDINWTVWRGFYVGPNVSDEDYQWWIDAFNSIKDTDVFKTERAKRGFYPFFLMGKDFDAMVKADVQKFKKLAAEAGL